MRAAFFKETYVRPQNTQRAMKNRIYQLMKHEGMSQKEFASELCIAEGTLSSIFTGRTKPSSNIVYSIHERFPRVDISWLMFGEGEMVANDAGGEALAASTSAVPPIDLFHGVAPVASPSAATSPAAPVAAMSAHPQRRIIEIKVFYDDGTFETFGKS